MHNIIARGHETYLSDMHDSTIDIVNALSMFLNDKFIKIYESLEEMAASDSFVVAESQILSKHHLSTFKEDTENEVPQVIMKSGTKSCTLDPIPTYVHSRSMSAISSGTVPSTGYKI